MTNIPTMDLSKLDTSYMTLGQVVQQYSELLAKHGPNLRTNVREIEVTESTEGCRAAFAATGDLQRDVCEYINGDRQTNLW